MARLADHSKVHTAVERDEDVPSKVNTPFPITTSNGALHRGSGCAPGDICAEWIAFLIPGIAIGLGSQSPFATTMFVVWILDYILTFAFWILFQYHTITPMRRLSVKGGIIAAIKPVTSPVTAWQISIYGFMVITYFAIFQAGFGVKLEMDTVEF